MVSGILGYIGNLCIQIISALGYPGLVILMAMESMVFPLPSELVMPFAGFLVAEGKMNFIFVAFFSVIGSITGSLISYYVGKFGGNKVVLKYGKYLLLSEEDLFNTESLFKLKGERIVFVSRFIPVVRHLISIPAGIGKMDIKRFILYTVIGAGCWNSILTYLGYVLGENWEKVKQYSEYISVPVLILLILGLVYFVWRHIKKVRVSSASLKNFKP